MIGMTEAMGKLMLGGKMEEVLDTVKSNYKHLKAVLDQKQQTDNQAVILFIKKAFAIAKAF